MNDQYIDKAVNIIKSGGVIAYPTEAVFGFGCDPLNEKALQRIVSLKNRDSSKGLIVVGASFENFEPLIYGGTGIDSANSEMPNTIPTRFEAGSTNILAISGLNAALTWIKEVGVSNIRETENKNLRRLLDLLNQYSNIDIIAPGESEKFIGVVSCVFKGYSSDNIGNILSENNIAVRTGLHCSPLAHKTLGTFPAGTVRFSIGYFNDEEDFASLEKVLEYIDENS
jgi:selenocysteine lyase/cysteine desulfurase